MPREIVTSWFIPSGEPAKTVMYFDDSISVASQRTALGAFWANVDGGLENSVSWDIDTTGRDVDSATGTLLGLWTDTTPVGGTGGVAGEVVPDASMVLIRWLTGIIIGGRFVNGRTFIPGLATANMVNGNLSTGIAALYTGYGNTLAAAGVGFSVWHRPVGGAGGFSAPVDSALCNTEMAVLRRRRNR